MLSILFPKHGYFHLTWLPKMPVVLAVVLICSACQSTHPLIDTLQSVVSTPRLQRDPKYDYLALDMDGRQGQMALGYRNVVNGVVTEHWYTSGEMLQMVNGRVDKALGMTQEIRRNKGTPPSWQALAESDQAINWVRQLDLLPGYRYGTEEVVVSRKLTKQEYPLSSFRLGDVDFWVRDDVESTNAQGQQWHYVQLFAIYRNRVVYSEQCISEKMCMRFTFIPHTAP
jgi:hypothetical protein